LAISFWAIDAVFTDPCESQARADPPTVRSLDGLASGLTGWWRQDSSEPVEPRRDLPIVTEPVETTVSGLPARSLELRIPDELDTTTCFRGRYATWRTAEGVRRLHRPGDVSRIWVIQVRPGSMLVIDATSPGEPSPDGLAGLSEIIESLRIGGAA
jgi:hypothetical protein